MKYPYTPEVLDALPESVAELFRQVEDDVLEGICTKLEAARYLARITVPDLKKLRDVSNADIERMIQDATGKGKTKIQSIMSDVVTQNTRFYTDMQSQMGLTSFRPILTGTVTSAIQQQTLDTYQNLSGSMGFLVDSGRTMLKPAKAYQWAIDNAIIQIQSGAMNYEQAIRYAVRTLAKSGIKTVSYESGKIDQMDVAVRRAVLTGANQLCLKFAEKAMDSLYTDLVEVSAHVGARNRGFEPENHEMWQGKVYRWTEKPRLSTGDYPDFIRHTGYGSGEGLGGWNCRHSFHAFVEGVSERTYTDDELNAMKGKNRTFQYEGREYDGYTATQKQREIERTLRKLKRERSSYKAAGLTDEYNAVNAKIRRLTYKYQQFSKKAGLPEQRERTKVQYTAPHDGKTTTQNEVDVSVDSPDVKFVCRIDKNLYKQIDSGMVTDEVVITRQQILHIEDGHPGAYELLSKYVPEVLQNPDYILMGNRPHTALVLKQINAENTNIEIVLRLKVQTDPANYKNSIITLWNIKGKRYRRLLRNSKILYKRDSS